MAKTQDRRGGPGPTPVLDAEDVYRLTQAQDWNAVLEALQAQARARRAPDDPRFEQAVQTFEDELFRQLAALPSAVLERVVLMHSGRQYRLAGERFERAVVALVQRLADDGRAGEARSYARFCPQHPACRAVLEEASEPVEGGGPRVPVLPPALEADFAVRRTVPADEDHSRRLFRSAQEERFFTALREVFPTYAIYPNVALSSVVDLDAVAGCLDPAVRRYAFRALVDAVVFDQQDGYRPRYFFELDSPHHDAAERQQKDAWKERVLAGAGQSLVRVRPHRPDVSVGAFVRLLVHLMAPGGG